MTHAGIKPYRPEWVITAPQAPHSPSRGKKGPGNNERRNPTEDRPDPVNVPPSGCRIRPPPSPPPSPPHTPRVPPLARHARWKVNHGFAKCATVPGSASPAPRTPPTPWAAPAVRSPRVVHRRTVRAPGLSGSNRPVGSTPRRQASTHSHRPRAKRRAVADCFVLAKLSNS
jgi:hypothetical protein